MLPKKRKQNVSTIKNLIGKERMRELMEGTDIKTMYLPKNIGIEDIDTSVYNLFKDEFQLTIDEEIIPVIYMTNERWGEFEKTWQYQDDDKNILPPFITIKRVNSPQKGTIWGDIYTYAQRRTFTYRDVPTLEDDFLIFTRYKIPQAAPIDLEYEVSFFSMYQIDENIFDEKIIRKFSSRQVYAKFNGNYFPSIIESSSNNDEVDDANGTKLYVSTYNVLVKGYLQDESEFEITKTTKFTRVDIGI